MIRFKTILGLGLCVALASSCSLRKSAPSRAIALVDEVLSGAEPQMLSVLHSYDPASPAGDVVVIDDPLRSAMLSSVLIGSDGHDNIDGSLQPDMLPDFAGERIVSQFDLETVYSSAVDSLLRETAVRAVVSALDTLCFQNVYDTARLSRKPAAKVVVMASPAMASAARFDVDTLLGASGAGLPVVYPAHDILEDVQSMGCANVAVISDMPSGRCYSRIMEDIGAGYSMYFACADSLEGAGMLESLLESYWDSGKRMPIDCVVIDTYTTDESQMRSQYARILLDPDVSEPLKALLSGECRFVSVGREVADRVYSLLRERNLFTHDIAKPKARAYVTRPGVGRYSLMQMDWSVLPPGLENDIMTEASQAYVSYVQD